MVVLFLQIGVFVLLLLLEKIFKLRALSFRTCGRFSMAALFLFTGSSHFYLTEAMVEMVPPQLPHPELIVYASGVFEMVAALGLFFQRTARITSWVLILLLLALLPANIYAAVARVGLGGHVKGPSYLWFRVPLQFFWIAWLWYFSKGESISTPRPR